MRTIKEGFLRKNLGLGKDELIKKWLDEHEIKNYKINKDLTIDIDGNVDLRLYGKKELPEYIQFGKIKGDFRIFHCPILISLRGCPQEVGKDFYCRFCGKQFTKDDVKKVSKVKGKIHI